MNILMTGATGFVGSNLLKGLLKDKHSICIVKRSFSNTERISECISKCRVYDIDEIQIQKIFEENKVECIIHCATFYGRDDSDYIKNIETNLLMPLELLNYGCQYGLRYFINTDSFFTKRIQTEMDLGEQLYMGGYTLSKIQFKQWGQIFSKKNNIVFVNMMLEHVYGEDDADNKFIEFVARKCRANEPILELSEGIQKRDFIYILDVVSAYRVVLKQLEQHKGNGYIEYQVGTGRMWSVREFVQLIHKAVNSQTELKFGAIKMKQGELMVSKADNQKLIRLGWEPQIVTEDAIAKLFARCNDVDAKQEVTR